MTRSDVEAVDARDQGAAIDSGFEAACADMGLDVARTQGLAKVARARLIEFRKIAGEMVPARPAAEVTETPEKPYFQGQSWHLPPKGNPAPLPAPGTTRLGNGGGTGNFATKPAAKPAPVALKPWAPPVPVPPIIPVNPEPSTAVAIH